MFVILVYDVNPKRDAKVLKTCREYLTWVQNSVFEGEITESKMRILINRLRSIIDREEDSVVVYKFESTRYSSREILGLRKGGEEWIL